MSENNLTKWEQFAPKWARDFDRFLSTYRASLIHGFTSDLQPLPQAYSKNSDFNTVELFSYFDEVYSGKIADRAKYGLTDIKDGYCVIGYNPTLAEGQRFEFFDNTAMNSVKWTGDDELDETANGDGNAKNNSPAKEEDKPNPFKGRDKDKAKFWAFINNENVEQQLPAGHGPGGLSLDFSRMHLALTNALKNKRPYMFVVLSSRMSMIPGNVSNAEENQAFAILSMLTNALDTRVNNKPNQNRLVIIADKSNDIPAWISNEQYNHTIKKFHIARPDTEARQYFFDNDFSYLSNMGHIRCDGEAIAHKKDDELTEQEKAYKATKKNFVGKTDGFSLRSLFQLTQYIDADSDRIKDITPENISLIIAAFKSGVSDNPWTKPDTFNKICGLKEYCKKTIVGQDRVLDAAATIMELAITEANRVFTPTAPRAVLFLAGPTGTGKTELAKQLTDLVFGNQDRMKRFDMSEFRADHTEARLFGAPPGYIGHGAGGELTEYVKRYPFSLILFDEIEKACSSIMDKFLQILSDGRLTDGQGETVDFSNTIIVMTSNAGIKDPREAGGKMSGLSEAQLMTPVTIDSMKNAEQRYFSLACGAADDKTEDEQADTLDEAEENCLPLTNADGGVINYVTLDMKANVNYTELDKRVERELNSNLQKHFSDVLGRPELYGRLKESIICYNFITADSARDIAMIYVDKVNDFYLEKHGITVQMQKGKPEVLDEVKNFVARACMNHTVRAFGARGIIEHVKTVYAGSLASFSVKNDARGKQVSARIEDKSIKWSII